MKKIYAFSKQMSTLTVTNDMSYPVRLRMLAAAQTGRTRCKRLTPTIEAGTTYSLNVDTCGYGTTGPCSASDTSACAVAQVINTTNNQTTSPIPLPTTDFSISQLLGTSTPTAPPSSSKKDTIWVIVGIVAAVLVALALFLFLRK
jgi:hypothetical protein